MFVISFQFTCPGDALSVTIVIDKMCQCGHWAVYEQTWSGIFGRLKTFRITQTALAQELGGSYFSIMLSTSYPLVQFWCPEDIKNNYSERWNICTHLSTTATCLYMNTGSYFSRLPCCHVLKSGSVRQRWSAVLQLPLNFRTEPMANLTFLLYWKLNLTVCTDCVVHHSAS